MSISALEPIALQELPPQINCATRKFYDCLLKAKTELAELRGYTSALADPMPLLNGIFIKEAVASAKIENVDVSIEKLMLQQLFPESEQTAEIREVLRYKSAMLKGFESMKRVALGNRLMLEIHKELMPGASYGYRTQEKQVENPVTNKLLYTCPPAQKMNRLMTNWENYLQNTEDESDPLVRCAISHYQLETIHPFSDDDGRTGRIIMALYFLHAKILHYPIVNISGYIARAPVEYYRLLHQVTEKGNWCAFIEWMLEGFFIQARETREQLLRLVGLQHQYMDKIKKECPRIYSARLVELLFSTPIITPVKLASQMDIHYTTASRYLKKLAERKFLGQQELGRYQLYTNNKLIGILNNEPD